MGAANQQLIADFIAAWPRLDTEEIVGFFAPDGIYHNMPMQPVQGTEALRAFIAGFLAGWTWTSWEVLNLVSAGDLVIAERVDHIKVGDKPIDLPVVGVFEIAGGKIKAWRDYFDLATYMNALA